MVSMIHPENKPTCTKDGQKVCACLLCDLQYTETIPSTGHEFSEWLIEKAPTQTEEGSKTRICAVCRDEETQSIPVLVYNIGNVDGQAEITANDALLALQVATGKIDLDDAAKTVADVDGTAGVTANDALMILQYATKKIAAFPVAG